MIHASLGNVHAVNLKENGSVNLESQVCSLELAKQLKELGIMQQSLFWYIKRKDYPSKSEHLVFGMPNFSYKDDLNGLMYNSPIWENTGWEFYSAFSLAELGKMLPDHIKTDSGFDSDAICYIKSQKKDNEYKIYIDCSPNIIIFFDEIEVDARAKMLIYLLENKLMELPND